MIDLNEFVFFVPEHMWGNTFRSVLPNVSTEQIINFQIGDPFNEEGTRKLIREKLIEAKEKVISTQKIPIIILPITSVYEYTSINNKPDHDIPLVKIIGPSFKTRDDIFLFLYKHKKREHNPAKIYPKGDENLTTTRIGILYSKIILENGLDPLWHDDVKTNPWGFSLKFEQCHKYNDRLKCINNPDYYGFIAAGIELKNFWDKKDWISAINLNSWISHYLKINYFPRTFFVSIDDCFKGENEHKLKKFWDYYVINSRTWLKNKKHQNGVHGLYYGNELALPIQIPSISDSDSDHFFQLAEDLSAIKKFLRLTKLETYRDFDFFDIFFMDDYLAYELYKVNDRGKLFEKIYKIIVIANNPKSEFDKYKKIINDFLQKKLNFKNREDKLYNILTSDLNFYLREKNMPVINQSNLKNDFQVLINEIKKEYYFE